MLARSTIAKEPRRRAGPGRCRGDRRAARAGRGAARRHARPAGRAGGRCSPVRRRAAVRARRRSRRWCRPWTPPARARCSPARARAPVGGGLAALGATPVERRRWTRPTRRPARCPWCSRWSSSWPAGGAPTGPVPAPTAVLPASVLTRSAVRLIPSKPVDGWSSLQPVECTTRAHGSPSWPHRRRPSTSSSPGASPPRSARASRPPASAACCKSRGLRVTMQKLDPYLNVDPGTMNPFQHGEVFVTDDGAETDLDIGHYERFLDTDLHGSANVTTGQVYSDGDRQGAPRRLPRRHRPGHPAHHQRDQGPDPRDGRPRRRRGDHRDRRHRRRHRVAAVPRGRPPGPPRRRPRQRASSCTSRWCPTSARPAS